MLIRTLLAIAMLSFACTQASRLLQQDVVASDPTLIDRSQPDWYVSMELQQQQQQQQQTELVELASLGAAAPSSTVIGDGTAAETRVASLVRAAAAKQGRKKPRANRRPPPKPSPRAEASPASAPSPKPSPAPSPALSPSPSPRRSPAPSPSPSPSPRSCLATPSDVLGPFYQVRQTKFFSSMRSPISLIISPYVLFAHAVSRRPTQHQAGRVVLRAEDRRQECHENNHHRSCSSVFHLHASF